MKAQLGFALAIAAYLLSFFHRVAPAAIAGDLQAAFGIDAVELGSLAAAYFYVYTLMQIPVGILADTLGPRRILFLGGVAAAAGSLLFGLAPDFATAFAGRTLVGFGVSFAFIAMLKIIATQFDERHFATLTGLCMLIGNFGSVLAGAPLAWAAQAASWRQVFVGIAVLSLLVAVASARFVVDQAGRPASRRAWLPGLRQVLANRATWPGFFANAGLAGSFFAFGGLWAVPYFVHVQGMTRSVAANHCSVYFIGFALGAAIWGRISDRLRRRRQVMLLVSGGNLACWAAWLLASPLPLAASYPLCLAMGVTSAGFTLTWAAAKEVNPPLLSGMATSVVNVGVFLGAAVLQPLVGWCIERSGDGTMVGAAAGTYSAQAYSNGVALLAAAATAGWLALFFIRETNCRNIWNGRPT